MRTILALLLGVMIAAAQEPNRMITRMIPVKNLSGSKFNSMVRMLEMITPRVRGDSQLSTVAVTDYPDVVNAVEAAIHKFDIPPPPDRNAEVSLFVMLGSPKRGETKVPAELEPVVKQLRGIFPYQSFRLLDAQFVRARDAGGHSSISGQLQNPSGEGSSYNYQASFRININEDSTGKNYRFDDFGFAAYLGTYRQDANGKETRVLSIGTNLDVREGQKAVVGKANLNSDSAIFVVISAK